MADFKRQRFVVAPHYLLENPREHVIILSDFEYWNDHYDELVAWLPPGSKIEGMGITLPDAHALTMFMLRWS